MKNFINFLLVKTIKKKSTWIIPLVYFICILAFSLVYKFLFFNQDNQYLSIYLIAFFTILFTMFYSGIKSTNLFVDTDKEGVDILSLSKPISKKTLVMSKNITLLIFSLIWASFILVSNLIMNFILLDISLVGSIFIIAIIAFTVAVFSFMFFGTIVTLISIKVGNKIGLIFPFIVFVPLLIGGVGLQVNSTSSLNNSAYYLNQHYKYNNAGNNLNSQQFFLNDKKDNLFLINNGINNDAFSQKQLEYINELKSSVKYSALGSWIYSWTILPFQFFDFYNFKSDMELNYLKQDSNNLKNYLYYHHNDLITNKYAFKKDARLLALNVEEENEVDGKITTKIVSKYVVPGALKNYSQFKNQINTSIIFARENASNFDISIPEDKYEFLNDKGLVGKLEWNEFFNILNDFKFNVIAKKFYEKLMNKFIQEKLNDPKRYIEASQVIIKAIQEFVQDENSEINTYENIAINTFNKDAIKNNLLDSEIQKTLYKAISLVYYLYFAYNDSEMLKALFKVGLETSNPNALFNFEFDGYKYQIGGYESYIPVDRVIEKENEDGEKVKDVVLRYELKENSKNTLFQEVSKDGIYEIRSDSSVVIKWVFPLIWTIIILLLVFGNSILYIRKEYK
ncbi:ABC transporter permease [Mycoplasma phocimorsus]|uniref:ABC transporter permease n=1 Tax=Mycoplasma phocimorsus TaxID=3045839 RepID=UPI0024C0C6FA|nr:ABC transporter permease [Mycoplasma phocimorsus]MDJ1646193.1 ABC transporter permease [Mycoplasma phocimorsus]MDJ1646790.1 ABC transporter permease [Mycoplasma phocimorsus]MDJ1648176.1 ABC transporter permease [Mycoplasma phocimorsus]